MLANHADTRPLRLNDLHADTVGVPALMGVGLVAFALYSFIEAAWRRINAEEIMR